MQKRKNRIEQWRAERRVMLGIDKVVQQSVAQTSKVHYRHLFDLFETNKFADHFKGKAWSLEDEGDDDEDESSTDLKRDVAAARETLMSSQADKQREALERAAEAAALASVACTNTAGKPNEEEDEEDPLDKYMETISKEVKSFRSTNATIISTKSSENLSKAVTMIKQEQKSANGKGSVIKVITKAVKSEVRKELFDKMLED